MMLSRMRRVTRSGIIWLRPYYYRLHGPIARVTRRKSYIVETFAGADPCHGSDSAAVFCHYDRRGVVHDYVCHYLKALCAANFRVYFVSNAPVLPQKSISALKPLCAKIIHRRNVGYDFGAYKEGVLSIPDRRGLARLLITNDSVYGPLQPLEQCLSVMSPDDADVWGLTDSYEMRYHLQSYFLLFHRAALQHAAFEKFWKDMPFVGAKWWVIYFGEVGLTQQLTRADLRIRCAFPYEAVVRKFRSMLRDTRALTREDTPASHRNYLQNLLNAADAAIPLNSTHFFWEVLIGRMGCPFIKRDLLESNPANIMGVSEWRDLVNAKSDYDVELIERHQKLRLRNRSI
jgi:lipopolysaccharide biosynthesis protein